jgi:glycosyltransferase involved in cell wall biosynthesis
MHILVIDSVYGRGGAAVVAGNLTRMLSQAGHTVETVVGHGTHLPPGVREIRQLADSSWWDSLPLKLAERVLQRFFGRSAGSDLPPGRENFNHPYTNRILREARRRPDILHCHNLHGDYFDLRQLRKLSSKLPTLLTMHDCWLMTGHCAHPFDCGKWETGCGACPDLSIPPAVPTDLTDENWKAKAAIYRESTFFVSTPCEWLMNRVNRSMLVPGIIEARVIRNGVDLDVFKPSDERASLRQRLGWEADETVLLFAANGIRSNIWKDFATLQSAVEILADRIERKKIRFVALGEDGISEMRNQVRTDWVPFIDDPRQLSNYLQAADLYLHAAKADTFPNTVLEALASGLPVVATAVGGIPEQIKGFRCPGSISPVPEFAQDSATGVLTQAGSAAGMASAIAHLVDSPELTARMRENARRDAEDRFSLSLQARAYIGFFEEMIEWGKRNL